MRWIRTLPTVFVLTPTTIMESNFTVYRSSGCWYSIDLTGASAFINKLAIGSGLTQIRLSFKLDDNNNAVANYLRLFSGNVGAANYPQLIITYLS